MQELIQMMLAFFLGLISPGPDFAIVSGHASQYGRRSGVYAALGISSAVWILVFASCYGLQNLFSVYPQSTMYFQLIGAVFLAYLGIKSLSAPLQKPDSIHPLHKSDRVKSSWLTGFLTNITNVKAVLFISGVLSQHSEYIQTFDHVLLITALITVGTFFWFSFIAFLFSIRGGSIVKNIQVYVPRVMGIFLLYLAFTFLISSGILPIKS